MVYVAVGRRTVCDYQVKEEWTFWDPEQKAQRYCASTPTKRAMEPYLGSGPAAGSADLVCGTGSA